MTLKETLKDFKEKQYVVSRYRQNRWFNALNKTTPRRIAVLRGENIAGLLVRRRTDTIGITYQKSRQKSINFSWDFLCVKSTTYHKVLIQVLIN